MAKKLGTMKTCSKCGESRAKSEFYKDNRRKDGLTAWCKTCQCQATTAWRKAHPEQKKVQYEKWKTKHHEHYCEYHKEYKKKWNEAHQESESARARVWRETHPEQHKANSQQWYALHRERHKGTVDEWHRTHSEQAKVTARAWQNSHPKLMKIYSSAWRKSHPDACKLQNHIRRARVLSAEGNFSVDQWQTLKSQYGYTCLYCGRKEPDIKLTPDHVIPLSVGGCNKIDNIQPLCLRCNCSKGAKTIDYRPGSATYAPVARQLSLLESQ